MSALPVFVPGDPQYEPRLRALGHRTAGLPAHVEEAARTIVADVRTRGDEAVRELTERFEHRRLDALELPRAEWEAAAATISPRVRTALEHAADRVRAFHQREQHPGFQMD